MATVACDISFQNKNGNIEKEPSFQPAMKLSKRGIEISTKC